MNPLEYIEIQIHPKTHTYTVCTNALDPLMFYDLICLYAKFQEMEAHYTYDENKAF